MKAIRVIVAFAIAVGVLAFVFVPPIETSIRLIILACFALPLFLGYFVNRAQRN